VRDHGATRGTAGAPRHAGAAYRSAVRGWAGGTSGLARSGCVGRVSRLWYGPEGCLRDRQRHRGQLLLGRERLAADCEPDLHHQVA
jgi:hypothetical protein